jgi:hypothetical protein
MRKRRVLKHRSNRRGILPCVSGEGSLQDSRGGGFQLELPPSIPLTAATIRLQLASPQAPTNIRFYPPPKSTQSSQIAPLTRLQPYIHLLPTISTPHGTGCSCMWAAHTHVPAKQFSPSRGASLPRQHWHAQVA